LPTISAIVPARNASATLERCLEAVAATGGVSEVIVIDDGSSDDTADTARRCGARVISNPARVGPAGARNTGARSAAGEILLFVDADVIVPPDICRKLSSAFEDSSVAAVQTLYTPVCPACDTVSLYQNFYYHYSFARIRESSIAVFATWCAAVRKADFLSMGGFNESIPDPTVEDEEFGYALADAGRTIVLDRSIQVVHLASYSISTFSKRRFRMARAQAKSGWRSVRNRLLLRYVNIRETGTHHSRLMVLGIMSMILSEIFLFSLMVSAASGQGILAAAAGSFICLSVSLACALPFLRHSVNSIGIHVVMPFLWLCLLDMAVLGWGLILGTLDFARGSRF